MGDRRTWQQWDAVTGSRIIDPDGFRGARASDDGLYTRDEFESRVSRCTIRLGKVEYSDLCPQCGSRFLDHIGTYLECPE